MSTTSEQAAYNAAHSKFSRTPEEQRRYITDNLHLLSDQDVIQLLNAMRASKRGDKAAIRRLVERKEQELKELEQHLLNGHSFHTFQQAVIADLEAGEVKQ